MFLVNNGYIQDGLKALVYFISLVYLVIKRKQIKFRYFWLMFAGLVLLFVGHLLDFCDEFRSLDYVFIVGNNYRLHDFYEDTIGFTLGFLIFIVALFLEFNPIRK